MKRIRFEVFKFGVSGFTPGKRKQAKMQHLVELGAKKARVMPINYKRLKDKRAKEKTRLEEEVNRF